MLSETELNAIAFHLDAIAAIRAGSEGRMLLPAAGITKNYKKRAKPSKKEEWNAAAAMVAKELGINLLKYNILQ